MNVMFFVIQMIAGLILRLFNSIKSSFSYCLKKFCHRCGYKETDETKKDIVIRRKTLIRPYHVNKWKNAHPWTEEREWIIKNGLELKNFQKEEAFKVEYKNLMRIA
jgi:hypothetical protein